MTPDPIVVRETATVSEAVRIFQALEIRHLPVVNAAHELVGMLSDRDLRALTIPDMVDGEWLGAIQLALEARIATAMSSDPLSVPLDADAPEIIDLMLDNKIGAVPVVDADGRIAGIVSYVDLLRALASAELQQAV
jgi:acetoin utilization protein AcuB